MAFLSELARAAGDPLFSPWKMGYHYRYLLEI